MKLKFLNRLGSVLQRTAGYHEIRRQFKHILDFVRSVAPPANSVFKNDNLNKYVDALLNCINEQMRLEQTDRFCMDDIDEQFQKKYWGMTVNGTLHATDGVFIGLDTFRRVNDVTIILKGNTRIIYLDLALDTIHMEYGNYTLNVGKLNKQGKFSIRVTDHMIHVRLALRMHKDNKMVKYVEVSQAELVKCDNFKISLTGFGRYGGNKLAKSIIKWYIHKHKGQFIADFNSMFKMSLQQLLVKII